MKQTKNKTLLEKVVDIRTKNKHDGPDLDSDVAIAWLDGKITQSQISKAAWPSIHPNTSTLVYTFLNKSLREAYRQGRIKIVE